MKRLAYSTVWILEHSCCLLHWMPGYTCQLTKWAYAIDKKFNAGFWHVAEPTAPDVQKGGAE